MAKDLMALDVFVGHKIGDLEILEFYSTQGEHRNRWIAKCKCECGNEKCVEWYKLARGSVRSCGCGSYGLAYQTEEVYAYYEDHPELGVEEVGKYFGISKQRVSQIVRRYKGVDKTLKEQKNERRSLVLQRLEERRELLDEVVRLRAMLPEEANVSHD